MDLSKVESLPTEMKIGDRIYEILSFFKDGKKLINGRAMEKWAREMNVNLGEDDGKYLLDHQQDIPEIFRGKVNFYFTNWCRIGDPDTVFYVSWYDDRWVVAQGRVCTGSWYNDKTRVIRRKS